MEQGHTMKKLLATFCVIAIGTIGAQFSVAGERDGSHAWPRTALTVYDATGKAAGVYDGGKAILNIDGIPVVMSVAKVVHDDGIVESAQLKWVTGQYFTFYPTSDCSGPSLITMGPPGARPIGLYRDASGDILLTIGADGPSTTTLAQAMNDDRGGCVSRPPGAPTTFPVPVQTWAAVKTVNLSRLYPEPLSVR
jgi:hypothetical protein